MIHRKKSQMANRTWAICKTPNDMGKDIGTYGDDGADDGLDDTRNGGDDRVDGTANGREDSSLCVPVSSSEGGKLST